jgi:hypothetical protein
MIISSMNWAVRNLQRISLRIVPRLQDRVVRPFLARQNPLLRPFSSSRTLRGRHSVAVGHQFKPITKRFHGVALRVDDKMRVC